MDDGLKGLNLEISYITHGENSFLSVINPILEKSVKYWRSVGYFSSSSLDLLSEGLFSIESKANSEIKLITSPKLSQEDIDAIERGTEIRSAVVEGRFIDQFEKELSIMPTQNLQRLASLIGRGILDIRIVDSPDGGIYHDKMAVFIDELNNCVVLSGSNNETYSGYKLNYEKIRVFKSWKDSERVEDEIDEFLMIWDGNNPFLKTYDFSEAISKKIIEITQRRGIKINTLPGGHTKVLYDYQVEAIQAWVANGYVGFFEMATGTGKTITAIHALKKLIESHRNVLTVIAVPYKHLVNQWNEDILCVFPEDDIILVSGENSIWEDQLINAIISKRDKSYNRNVIVISTLNSFYTVRFQDAIKKFKESKLLIVDEAHNIISRIISGQQPNNFEFRLGLSATPSNGNDFDRTRLLINYFSKVVFALPIDSVIGKYLVNYEYHPYFVDILPEEEENYKNITRQMSFCFDQKTKKLVDYDRFIMLHKKRVRILALATNKLLSFPDLFDSLNVKDHFIVYCSDGKLYENSSAKHLLSVVKLMNERNLKPTQFTAEESMTDRESIIMNFNDGHISLLAAIRCLDEGINIPSIEHAFILSSNDNMREFIQRRGRILRKYPGKKLAHIYDFIILPSIESQEIAGVELRRFYEYSRLSINWKDLSIKLNELLEFYGLNYDRIKFKDNYVMESETENE